MPGGAKNVVIVVSINWYSLLRHEVITMRTYGQLGPQEQTWNQIKNKKHENCLSRKNNWKYRLQTGVHLAETLMH